MAFEIGFHDIESLNYGIFSYKTLDAIRLHPHEKHFIMNFKGIKFIPCTTITKICCFGEKAKKNGIVIEIIADTIVVEFLCNIGFWEIAKKYNLFVFDEDYCYMKNNNKTHTCALFRLEKKELFEKWDKKFDFANFVSEKNKYLIYVQAELLGEANTRSSGYIISEGIPKKCKSVIETVAEFSSVSDEINDNSVMIAMIQLAHNSVWHSEGITYFLAQTVTFENQVVDITISIADGGIGACASLVKKNDNELYFYNKNNLEKSLNPYERNRKAIIESLFFRLNNSGDRGIYHILKDFADEPPRVKCELKIYEHGSCVTLRENKNENDKRKTVSYLLNCVEQVFIQKIDNNISIKNIEDMIYNCCKDKDDSLFSFGIDINLRRKK